MAGGIINYLRITTLVHDLIVQLVDNFNQSVKLEYFVSDIFGYRRLINSSAH